MPAQTKNVFKHVSGLADDMCVINSMYTEQINHDPAHTFFNTGTAISGRPSMGSWVLYGLACAGVSVCQVHDVPYNIQLAAASHCKAVERTYHVRGCRRA